MSAPPENPVTGKAGSPFKLESEEAQIAILKSEPNSDEKSEDELLSTTCGRVRLADMYPAHPGSDNNAGNLLAAEMQITSPTTSADVPHTDGNITGGYATEGDATEGQLNEGDATEGQANESQANEGNSTEGQLNDGNANEGQVNEGHVNEGQVTEGQVNEGQVTENQAGDMMTHDNSPGAANQSGAGQDGGNNNSSDDSDDTSSISSDSSDSSSSDDDDSDDEGVAASVTDTDGAVPGAVPGAAPVTDTDGAVPGTDLGAVLGAALGDNNDDDTVPPAIAPFPAGPSLEGFYARHFFPAELEDADDDDPKNNVAVRTRNESEHLPLPKPQFKIPKHKQLICVGPIHSIVGNVVTIRATIGVSAQPLDDGTIIVRDSHEPIGAIMDTFGTPEHLYYMVGFENPQDIPDMKLTVGELMYYPDGYAQFVPVNEIKKHKGYDASNNHDEEEDDVLSDYGDDLPIGEARPYELGNSGSPASAAGASLVPRGRGSRLGPGPAPRRGNSGTRGGFTDRFGRNGNLGRTSTGRVHHDRNNSYDRRDNQARQNRPTPSKADLDYNDTTEYTPLRRPTSFAPGHSLPPRPVDTRGPSVGRGRSHSGYQGGSGGHYRSQDRFDGPRDGPRDMFYDAHRDGSRDSRRDFTDAHRDGHRDFSTDTHRDSHRDFSTDAHRDSRRDFSTDSYRDGRRDFSRDILSYGQSSYGSRNDNQSPFYTAQTNSRQTSFGGSNETAFERADVNRSARTPSQPTPASYIPGLGQLGQMGQMGQAYNLPPNPYLNPAMGLVWGQQQRSAAPLPGLPVTPGFQHATAPGQNAYSSDSVMASLLRGSVADSTTTTSHARTVAPGPPSTPGTTHPAAQQQQQQQQQEQHGQAYGQQTRGRQQGQQPDGPYNPWASGSYSHYQ